MRRRSAASPGADHRQPGGGPVAVVAAPARPGDRGAGAARLRGRPAPRRAGERRCRAAGARGRSGFRHHRRGRRRRHAQRGGERHGRGAAHGRARCRLAPPMCWRARSGCRATPNDWPSLIAAGPARPIWPGRVGGRLFLTMASSGFDAETVAAVNPRLKQHLGRLAFAWAIVVCLWRYRACELCVRVDGVDHRAATVIAAKGPFYAGSYVIAPRADLAEPMLDLVLFQRSGRLAVLRYLGALLLGRVRAAQGHHRPAVRARRRCRPPKRSRCRPMARSSRACRC